MQSRLTSNVRSLSARRAWIEIVYGLALSAAVAVALRKESVDRNAGITSIFSNRVVALRKESVDRNVNVLDPAKHKKRSLSARRAWIEILTR